MSFSVSDIFNSLPFVGGSKQKPLLVIALDEFWARAVVFHRTEAELSVVKTAEINFEVSGRSNRVKISKLMEKIGSTEATETIVLLPEITGMSTYLKFPPKKRLSREKRDGILRIEMKPYLEGDPDNFHFSLYSPPVSGESEEPEEGSEVTLFSASDELFLGLAGILKGYKKQLVGLAGCDVQAWGICGDTVASTGTVAIVTWQGYELIGALVVNGVPVRFSRAMIQAGDDGIAAIHQLVDELSDGQPLLEVVVGGDSVEMVEIVTDYSPNVLVVKRWSVREELPSVNCKEQIRPRFMPLVAAAINATRPRDEQIIVTRYRSLVSAIKANVHAVPMVFFILILIAVFGTFFITLGKKQNLAKGFEKREQQRTEVQTRIDDLESFQKRSRDLQKQVRDIEDNRQLITTHFAQFSRNELAILDGITSITPPSIELLSLEQNGDGKWKITGKAISIREISKFNISLNKLTGVTKTSGADQEQRTTDSESWFQFSLTVQMKGVEDR